MDAPNDNYVVAPIPAAELTKNDLTSCIAIIRKGAAVAEIAPEPLYLRRPLNKN
jgi:hypothetical protein